MLILSTKALGGEYCPVQGLRASQRLIPHWCKLDQDARGDARRELLEEATPTPPPIERFRLVHRYREGISRGRFTGQFACSVFVVDCNMAEAITLWRDLARVDVSTTPAVEAIAEAIAERGVKAMDALHVASAITAGATWLLTTDLKLIRKMHGDDRIVVAGPIDFIRYWQGDDDENRVCAETGRGPGADCGTRPGGCGTLYRGLASGAIRLHPMER